MTCVTHAAALKDAEGLTPERLARNVFRRSGLVYPGYEET